MKKAVLMAVVIMMTPPLASAQSRFSVAPALDFYKADLDKLDVRMLSLVKEVGGTVQKPNGGLQFGGRLNYEKSPHLTLRAEVSHWQDHVAAHAQDETGTLNFTDEIRLMPIMVGAQYNFSQPEANIRLYAGASGGIVLVKAQSQIEGIPTDPEEESINMLTESSGRDFIGKPFVGLELGARRNLVFFTELGYVFGKFTAEEVDLESGEKISEDNSINGLHLTGGIKLAF